MNTFSQKLDLRQAQGLVMTPQLQQAIKLLQLNNIELSAYVEEQLAGNPFLEKKEDSEDAPISENKQSDQENETDSMREEFDEAWDNEPQSAQDFDKGSAMADIGSGGNLKFEDAENSFENRLSRPETLREHLSEQAALTFHDPRDRNIALLLIDHLDESGYIRTDISQLSERIGSPEEKTSNVLDTLKKFDPSGICAQSLEDCLTIQLKEKGIHTPAFDKMLHNLNLLAEHDHKKLCQICDVDAETLNDMIREIRTLNPKPAAEFDHIVVQTAIPDVMMKKRPKTLGGGWRVELNNDTLPKVLVNKRYYKDVLQQTKQKEDKAYLSEQINAASWLTKALDQRAQTILKVAAEIVKQQEPFFYYGIEFLRPLVLKDIAEEIEMHESTVSRVTTNKYIGTPRGLFELKFFFSTALGGENGEIAHSSEAVKARIKTLIDAEDVKKILSDDKIVTKLKEEGIDIARRTVAKYREAMNIPSSVQRRRIKKNKAAGK